MVVKFGEKFGLESDRVKLAAGIGKFEVVRIEIKESKKEYDTKDGAKKIKIAHIDVVMKSDGSTKKYYSPNGPILQACEDMLNDIGVKSKDGTLKEPVYIDEVKTAGTKGREYIFFA
jgi:hypothetical protein